MSRHRAKTTITEKGQVMVMAALVMLVLVAAIGLAIDLGRIFVARAELVRAVDAAALAGTLELPDLDKAQGKVEDYFKENEPDASVEAPISPQERQIQVKGTKTVPMFFMKIFAVGSVDVTAHATAGFGVLAVDTVMAIDATYSMTGSPMTQAKIAAKDFTDTLLSGSVASQDTLVGVAPYRGCHKLSGTSQCVSIPDWVTALSNDKSYVDSRIDNIVAEPFSFTNITGTNVCNGLAKANEVINGAGHHSVSNMLKIIVVLSDGQNMYLAAAYTQGLIATTPASGCVPPTPTANDSNVRSTCGSPGPKQRNLDIKTKAMAAYLQANGVEIYVVGLGVCGTANPSQYKTTAYCAGIGDSATDSTGNRRLLKCIASSMDGTNDHYYEAATAAELPAIFQNIARLIGFRLIE